jgi:hypothetical protein
MQARETSGFAGNFHALVVVARPRGAVLSNWSYRGRGKPWRPADATPITCEPRRDFAATLPLLPVEAPLITPIWLERRHFRFPNTLIGRVSDSAGTVSLRLPLPDGRQASSDLTATSRASGGEGIIIDRDRSGDAITSLDCQPNRGGCTLRTQARGLAITSRVRTGETGDARRIARQLRTALESFEVPPPLSSR